MTYHDYPIFSEGMVRISDTASASISLSLLTTYENEYNSADYTFCNVQCDDLSKLSNDPALTLTIDGQTDGLSYFYPSTATYSCSSVT
jgi:hypothetical protein